MLALSVWRDRRCRGCGGDLVETTDDANSGELDATGKYERLPPVRCYRCTALSMSEDANKSGYHPHALIHRVQWVPRRPRTPPI